MTKIIKITICLTILFGIIAYVPVMTHSAKCDCEYEYEVQYILDDEPVLTKVCRGNIVSSGITYPGTLECDTIFIFFSLLFFLCSIIIIDILRNGSFSRDI